MHWKSKGGGFGELHARSVVSTKWTLMLCILSFCAGLLFTNRYNLTFSLVNLGTFQCLSFFFFIVISPEFSKFDQLSFIRLADF